MRERGNVQGIAALIFDRYVFAFEATSALLITAALGAMVLAHRERLTKRLTQSDLAGDTDEAVRRDRPASGPLPPRRLRPAQRGGHTRAASGRELCPSVGLGHVKARGASCTAEAGQPSTRRSDAIAADEATRAAGTIGGRSRMSPTRYIVLSAILFTIGTVGFMIRRNAIVAFMCVELMLNATNLALVTFSRITAPSMARLRPSS